VAIAAFVVSILAVVASSVAVFFTKRQSDAATRMAELEAERRHQERSPTFTGGIELVNDGQWHRLWLRLTSRERLSRVEVEITEGTGVSFTAGQYGVDPTKTGPILQAHRAGEHGATELAPDERTTWRIQLTEPRSPEIRLAVHSTSGDAQWNTTVPISVPTNPSVW